MKRRGLIKNGVWTKQEHRLFLESLIKYGRNWMQMSKYIKGRSPSQCRSHAQKFMLKMSKLGLFLKQINKHPVETNDINYMPASDFNGDKFLQGYMRNDAFFTRSHLNTLKTGEFVKMDSKQNRNLKFQSACNLEGIKTKYPFQYCYRPKMETDLGINIFKKSYKDNLEHCFTIDQIRLICIEPVDNN